MRYWEPLIFITKLYKYFLNNADLLAKLVNLTNHTRSSDALLSHRTHKTKNFKELTFAFAIVSDILVKDIVAFSQYERRILVN